MHLNTFKIEDTGLLAHATFPQGSVLHVRISTPIGNKNSVKYTQTQTPNGAHAFNAVKASLSYEKTLEQRGNDLNATQEQHPNRALVVKYALNDRAWSATKAALNLP
ncbi:hypothetical protein D3C78_1615920 [compost metagenome]